MTSDAQRVVTYLQAKGYNSARETAQDCALDESGLDAAMKAIEGEGKYRVCKGVRLDSYGHEVVWLKDA